MLDACSSDGHTTSHPSVSHVTTPLNAACAARRVALARHPDPQFTEYVLAGIEHGFRVGFA